MKILVVEDERRIADAVKKGLEQERYAVDVAYAGEEGQDLALGEDYDLVILDRRLGEIDGLEICKKMRREKIPTPVLILTARGQVRDRVEGLDAGADDYLVKPFSFAELVARVRALVRRPKAVQNETLAVADVSLNTRDYSVRRAGRPVNLSKREFALLEYLMRHPNQVRSKEQIIAQVWNFAADVLPNTVEVYVGNLRIKLGSGLIQTVRGFGYKVCSSRLG